MSGEDQDADSSSGVTALMAVESAPVARPRWQYAIVIAASVVALAALVFLLIVVVPIVATFVAEAFAYLKAGLTGTQQ